MDKNSDSNNLIFNDKKEAEVRTRSITGSQMPGVTFYLDLLELRKGVDTAVAKKIRVRKKQPEWCLNRGYSRVNPGELARDLTFHLHNKFKQVENLQRKLQGLEDHEIEIRKLKKDLNAANGIIKQKDQDFEDRDERIKEGQKELEAANQRVEQKEKDFEDSDERIKQGQKELEAANQRVKQREKEFESAKERIKQKDKELNSAYERIREGDQNLDDLREEFEREKKKTGALIDSFDGFGKAISSFAQQTLKKDNLENLNPLMAYEAIDWMGPGDLGVKAHEFHRSITPTHSFLSDLESGSEISAESDFMETFNLVQPFP